MVSMLSVNWPFKLQCSDTSTLFRYDVGQRLILERVPAIRCRCDPQGLHGPRDRSAALCHPQHGGGSIPGRAVAVTVEESQHLWVDDPVLPAQLLKADFDLGSVAVAVLRPLLRGPLEQVDSGKRPGNGDWCVAG